MNRKIIVSGLLRYCSFCLLFRLPTRSRQGKSSA